MFKNRRRYRVGGRRLVRELPDGLVTSSVDTDENALSEKPDFTWLKVGGGALLVLSLTLVDVSIVHGLAE